MILDLNGYWKISVSGVFQYTHQFGSFRTVNHISLLDQGEYIGIKVECREKLVAKRLEMRQNQNPLDQIPACPKCGKPMVLRTAKTGKNAGKQFWGCSAYPDCKGVATV